MRAIVILAALMAADIGATPPQHIAQQHVLTADYLGAPYGSASITPGQAAPFLTWAQVTVRNADAVSAAGIKTQYYIDPTLTIANRGDQLYSSDEAAFAHDCGGNRVSIPYHSLTEYVMQVDSPPMRALFNHVVGRITHAAHFDALFEDDAQPPSEYIHFASMPCNYSDAGWLHAVETLNEGAPIPVIVNGLSAVNRPAPSAVMQLLTGRNTIGANYEHCYSDDAHPKIGGTVWEATENSEIGVVNTGKTFSCMARDLADAASSTDERLYLYASFLLSYDPTTSVLWEEYKTPSMFRVEPESGLVALHPLTGAPHAVTDLQTSGGSYARRFAACYLAGKLVGSCAVVVNPDSQAHPFPYSGYTRTLTLSGGGVLDGGSASANGPAPSTSVGPNESVIAFR